MNGRLSWNDLSESEKEQAEHSFLSILDDIADCGDVSDCAYYQEMLVFKEERVKALANKTFIRDPNGIFSVSLTEKQLQDYSQTITAISC